MNGDRSLIGRYRERAKQIRQLIAGMPPSEARDLLEIAVDYDELGGGDRTLIQSNRPHTDS